MRTNNQKFVWDTFRGLCVLCLRPASSIHEIVPRSSLPTEWDEIDNMVPLCSECHSKIQENPSQYETKLRNQRDYLLQVFGSHFEFLDK